MVSLEVTTDAKSAPEDIAAISKSWVEAGRRVEATVQRWNCAIAGCHTLAFVVLRTQEGTRSFCLTHFDQIRDSSELQRTTRRTRSRSVS